MVSQQPESFKLDLDRLTETALPIFTSLVGRPEHRGTSLAVLAEQAFAQAAAFEREAYLIQGGKAVVDRRHASEAPLFALVHLCDGSKGEKGEPMFEEDTHKPITEVQPVDRYAFAPNLPEGHPINQRFAPNAIKSGRLCDEAGNLLPAERVREIAEELRHVES
jgi:hypothetical protein